MAAGVSIKLDGYDELIKTLDRIDDTLTRKTKREMLKAGAEVVAAKARSLCPIGNTSHHPENKPLAETIEVVIRDYGVRGLAVIGPGWPAGAHAHLVEDGHEIRARGKTGAREPGSFLGRKTRPRPFMRPAFDSTHGEQMAAMERVIATTVRELGGS